jgi:hypothetical protein
VNRTYAAHNKDPAHFLLELYTRAGENAPLARTLFRADVALPFTVPKANNRGVRRIKNGSHARCWEYAGRAGSPNGDQGFRTIEHDN